MFEVVKKKALSIYKKEHDRSWGKSIILNAADKLERQQNYREKFLIFKPGESIILESHADYSEVWVADDHFEYALEDERGMIHKHIGEPYERVFILKGRKHKIKNPNKKMLHIFEIQIGIISSDDKTQYKDEDRSYSL